MFTHQQEPHTQVSKVGNWEKCELDLYWSANYSYDTWRRFGEGLLAHPQDEEAAYNLIQDAQSHDRESIDNLDSCRNQNLWRFWQIAYKVWSKHGPQPQRSVERH